MGLLCPQTQHALQVGPSQSSLLSSCPKASAGDGVALYFSSELLGFPFDGWQKWLLHIMRELIVVRVLRAGKECAYVCVHIYMFQKIVCAGTSVA